MQRPPDVEYYMPEGISEAQIYEQVKKIYHGDLLIMIHKHAKGEACTDICDVFELNY